LFKIGEFSRLSGVSIRMLRHYDEIGLLRPAHVDEWSGYRYYTGEQLTRLTRLLAFRELGFSLAEVACLLDGRLPAGEVQAMLARRRDDLRREIRERQGRLAQVEAQLEHFNPDLPFAGYRVALKRVERLPVVSVRRVIATYGHSRALLEEVLDLLRRRGVTPVGPGITVFHDIEGRDRDVDVEAAYPVAAGVGFSQTLPEIATAATVVHEGSMDRVGFAYRAAGAWILAHGYRITGPSRCILLDRGEDPERWRTEVQWPVERETTPGT
jgi:DNA-binding transcriptional MerR regulator